MQPRRPRRIEHPQPTRRPHPQRSDAPASAPEPGLVRVSKRMAAMGLCSRREADEWIAKGWVRVDGERITELGARAGPGQRITIERAARAAQDGRVTVLLNKPIGIVSGQAEQGYKPAIALIGNATHWPDDPVSMPVRAAHLRGLAPAGRLDIDSTGLLVLTQDGRIARRLIGADSAIEKEYLVRVAGTLPAAALRRLNHGLSLDGVALKPARVEWLNADQLRFVLIEGRKRQIRRMCEAVGLQVQGLKRVRIGGVMLGRLPLGQWRYLAAGERFD
ncbi:MAG: rRNA pseudouridine synthase [Burkholderiales bacterium]|nr:rRNA pseudouridine synthase [Burkholderiales bacterium]